MEYNNDILRNQFNIDGVHNPYQLYRRMRPEYFSDSYSEKLMDKDMFTYYLSNLSKDMKQDQFEEMTRQIVCKLITPNLIPQTGPTGGGDGKTDIETYNVDESISEKWYYADACKGTEKWAFAISCKTDWKTKIDSDVKKIVNTNRGFNRIYFCTNQKVRSKDKADLYDKYKADYSVEVNILDLNWYEQSVFENRCYDIAIKTLNLSKQFEEKIVEGPGDKEKRNKFNKLQEKLDNVKVEGCLDTAYVEDLLTLAILSRELELPKSEIQGRFSLALEQAKKYGTKQQVFNVIYQKGWTSFYWFEDPDDMYQQYLQLKEMLQEEINPIRVEKTYNLYNLVITAIGFNLFKVPPTEQKDKDFWDDLRLRLSTEEEHKSSYLYLKICSYETQIISLLKDHENIDNVLLQLRDSLKEVPRHIDISFEMHATIVAQIGVFITDNPVFEEIVDMIAEQEAKMDSEVRFALIHFERGVQNLDNMNFINAIKHLGKCIIAFQKEKTKSELVQALGMLAFAYKSIDLLYSSKVLFVKTLSLMFHKVETEGVIDHLIITVLFELSRLELRVGDINAFFNWLFELDRIVALHPSFADDSYKEQRLELDTMLGAISLSTSCCEQEWSMIPSICQQFELMVAKDLILYNLGYEDETTSEFKDSISSDSKWKEQLIRVVDSSIKLFNPTFANKKSSSLQTLVNGCKFFVTFHSDKKCRAYAEMLLAYMESFLATLSECEIAIAFPEIFIEFKLKNSGMTSIKKGRNSSEYTININQSTVTEHEYWELCSQFIFFFLTQNSIAKNPEKMLDKKFTEDSLLDRLSILSDYTKTFHLACRDDYKNCIEQWWKPEYKKYKNKKYQKEENPTMQNRGKQARQIITDLIDYPLWDKAMWSGCGYMMAKDRTEPPIILFMFVHYKYAKKIFDKWKQDFLSQKLNLKLTFVKGVDKENPMWYRLLVTPDYKQISKEKNAENGRYVIAATRCYLMKAESDRNLCMFESLYEIFHIAGLSAVEIDDGQMSTNPDKRYPYIIPIKNIEFREAWTIGINDPDSIAILSTDKPIIPAEHKLNAPIIKLIETKVRNTGKNA